MNNQVEAHFHPIREQLQAASLRLEKKDYRSLLEAIEAKIETELDTLDEQSNEDEITT